MIEGRLYTIEDIAEYLSENTKGKIRPDDIGTAIEIMKCANIKPFKVIGKEVIFNEGQKEEFQRPIEIFQIATSELKDNIKSKSAEYNKDQDNILKDIVIDEDGDVDLERFFGNQEGAQSETREEESEAVEEEIKEPEEYVEEEPDNKKEKKKRKHKENRDKSPEIVSDIAGQMAKAEANRIAEQQRVADAAREEANRIAAQKAYEQKIYEDSKIKENTYRQEKQTQLEKQEFQRDQVAEIYEPNKSEELSYEEQRRITEERRMELNKQEEINRHEDRLAEEQNKYMKHMDELIDKEIHGYESTKPVEQVSGFAESRQAAREGNCYEHATSTAVGTGVGLSEAVDTGNIGYNTSTAYTESPSKSYENTPNVQQEAIRPTDSGNMGYASYPQPAGPEEKLSSYVGQNVYLTDESQIMNAFQKYSEQLRSDDKKAEAVGASANWEEGNQKLKGDKASGETKDSTETERATQRDIEMAVIFRSDVGRAISATRDFLMNVSDANESEIVQGYRTLQPLGTIAMVGAKTALAASYTAAANQLNIKEIQNVLIRRGLMKAGDTLDIHNAKDLNKMISLIGEYFHQGGDGKFDMGGIHNMSKAWYSDIQALIGTGTMSATEESMAQGLIALRNLRRGNALKLASVQSLKGFGRRMVGKLMSENEIYQGYNTFIAPIRAVTRAYKTVVRFQQRMKTITQQLAANLNMPARLTPYRAHELVQPLARETARFTQEAAKQVVNAVKGGPKGVGRLAVKMTERLRLAIYRRLGQWGIHLAGSAAAGTAGAGAAGGAAAAAGGVAATAPVSIPIIVILLCIILCCCCCCTCQGSTAGGFYTSASQTEHLTDQIKNTLKKVPGLGWLLQLNDIEDSLMSGTAEDVENSVGYVFLKDEVVKFYEMYNESIVKSSMKYIKQNKNGETINLSKRDGAPLSEYIFDDIHYENSIKHLLSTQDPLAAKDADGEDAGSPYAYNNAKEIIAMASTRFGDDINPSEFKEWGWDLLCKTHYAKYEAWKFWTDKKLDFTDEMGDEDDYKNNGKHILVAYPSYEQGELEELGHSAVEGVIHDGFKSYDSEEDVRSQAEEYMTSRGCNNFECITSEEHEDEDKPWTDEITGEVHHDTVTITYWTAEIYCKGHKHIVVYPVTVTLDDSDTIYEMAEKIDGDTDVWNAKRQGGESDDDVGLALPFEGWDATAKEMVEIRVKENWKDLYGIGTDLLPDPTSELFGVASLTPGQSTMTSDEILSQLKEYDDYTNVTEDRKNIIAKALSYVGNVSYYYGASNPDNGVSDCSAFISKVLGISRVSTATFTTYTGTNEPVPGDLMVRYNYAGKSNHVMMYLGKNPDGGIVVVDCSSGKYNGVAKHVITNSYASQYKFVTINNVLADPNRQK